MINVSSILANKEISSPIQLPKPCLKSYSSNPRATLPNVVSFPDEYVPSTNKRASHIFITRSPSLQAAKSMLDQSYKQQILSNIHQGRRLDVSTNNYFSGNQSPLLENLNSRKERSIKERQIKVPLRNKNLSMDRPSTHSSLAKRYINNQSGKKSEASDLDELIPPRTASDSYSYCKQKLLYIPENIQTVPTVSKQKNSFMSFDVLARTTKNSHLEVLNDILSKDMDVHDSSNSLNSRENAKLNIIKKVLKFNEMQKDSYVNQLNDHTKRLSLQSLAINKQNISKGRNSPMIRITASKKMIDEDQTSYARDIIDPSSHLLEDNPTPIPKDTVDCSQDQRANNKSHNLSQYFNKRIKDELFRVFWHYSNRERGQWKPNASERHTLNVVGKMLIAYGGIGDKVYNNAATYDPVRDIWTNLDMKGDIPQSGRHSHTACEFKGSLIIFGGELGFSKLLRLRECTNDLYVLDARKKEWRCVKPLEGRIDARRNHAAAIHNKLMYVYGGIDMDGQYLNDVWTFNLSNLRWIQLKIAADDRETGIAFHTACACFNKKTTGIFEEKFEILDEGLYVFGGKECDGSILNTMKILTKSSNFTRWIYPSIKGQPPLGRYNHSMIYYESIRSILIYGGKNENLYHSTQNVCFNDIAIINLESMVWSAASCVGNVPTIGRSGHGMALYGTTLAIFGGVGYNEYAAPDMKLIEINQFTVSQLIKQYQVTELDKSGDQGIERMTPNLDYPKNTFDMKAYPKQEDMKAQKVVSWEILSNKNQNKPGNSLDTKKNIKDQVSQKGFTDVVKALTKVEKERLVFHSGNV